jgi:hypothetical protein
MNSFLSLLEWGRETLDLLLADACVRFAEICGPAREFAGFWLGS